MEATRLELMGGFRLWVGTREVSVAHPGQRLLALLALRGPTIRSIVAGTLWPDVPERRAAGNLRSVRWRLPLPDLVLSRGDVMQLPVGLGADLAEPLVAEGLPGCAESAESAELLPGWDEPWLDLPRQQLREARLRALERLALARLAEGRHREAVACATQAIALDPLREPAYRLLVELHLAEGNPAAALRVGRGYAELLGRELGLGPSEQMTSLLAHLVWVRRPGDAAVTAPSGASGVS